MYLSFLFFYCVLNCLFHFSIVAEASVVFLLILSVSQALAKPIASNHRSMEQKAAAIERRLQQPCIIGVGDSINITNILRIVKGKTDIAFGAVDDGLKTYVSKFFRNFRPHSTNER